MLLSQPPICEVEMCIERYVVYRTFPISSYLMIRNSLGLTVGDCVKEMEKQLLIDCEETLFGLRTDRWTVFQFEMDYFQELGRLNVLAVEARTAEREKVRAKR